VVDIIQTIFIVVILSVIFCSIFWWITKRVQNNTARMLLGLVPLAFGILAGISSGTAPHGYVASYVFGPTFALALLIFVLGILMTIWKPLRVGGISSMVSGIVILVGLYGAYEITTSLITNGKPGKSILMGPDANANLVVLFEKSITHDQIETFWKNTFSTHWDYVRGMLRLNKIDGHEAMSINFRKKTSFTKRHMVKSNIIGSPLIYKVYEDLSPIDLY